MTQTQTMIRTSSIPSLYQLSCLKCVSVCIRVCVCTWLQRILNVKHSGSVPNQHAFLHFILGQVRATIFDPDPRLQVVKMPSVQLKKLNQQYTEVWVWTTHVLSVVQLGNKTAIIIILILNILFISVMTNLNFEQPLLQSSVSHY